MSGCNNVNPITGGSTVDDIPFYLAVQQGKVPGYSMINKFGYNPSIGSGSFETIWETGNNYPWQSSAVTVDVVSDDVNDDVASKLALENGVDISNVNSVILPKNASSCMPAYVSILNSLSELKEGIQPLNSVSSLSRWCTIGK